MVAALEIIKSAGPISALDLANRLGLAEKQARTAIDKLRAGGEPIWLDKERGFWWRQDISPSGIAHEQWKREFTNP